MVFLRLGFVRQRSVGVVLVDEVVVDGRRLLECDARVWVVDRYFLTGFMLGIVT